MTASQLKNIQDIRDYMFAGRAEFTLHSLVSDKHFTYKILCDFNVPDHPIRFLYFLTGSDNEQDFRYAGVTRAMKISPDKSIYFSITKKSPPTHSPAITAYKWFIRQLNKGELPDTVEFMHSGKCSACGRKLTTPESISTGLGPVCRSKL